MVELYLGAAAIAVLGVLWFYVVRPMLEDFNLIAPRESENISPRPAVPYVERSERRNAGTSPLEPPVPSAPEPHSHAAPEPATEPATDRASLTEETLQLSWQEIVKALATVEMLDDAGQAAPLSKKKIALLVGRRQEDVSAVVDAARGKVVEEAPPRADPRFPESTRDGRPVAQALRTKARA